MLEVYADAGVSGTKDLFDRPALADALDAVRHRRVEGVVVHRLDRLARELVLQEQLLAEVRRLKGQVFSTMAGEAGYLDDDPEDPSRRLIRQVLGAVSEYERSVIAMRLRSGRRRKASNGGYAHGSPPLGTRAVGGALVEDADECKVLDRIAELRKAGRSLRQIGATLDTEGLKPKRADRWHAETLRRAVARAEARHGSPSTVGGLTGSRRPQDTRP
jgi:DNA invertase Pin-like site-specific DNA recombinase